MHKYAVGEDSILSKSTTVSIADIFEKSATFCNKILDMREMNLIANQKLADRRKRLKWNGESKLYADSIASSVTTSLSSGTFTIKNRTFYVTFGKLVH